MLPRFASIPSFAAFVIKVTVLLLFIICLLPREVLSTPHLLFQNSSDGTLVYWSLESTGKLKNNTRNDGWDYVNGTEPGTNWRLAGVQLNADGQRHTHLIMQNTNNGTFIYWSLNNKGALKNRTLHDGWDFISDRSQLSSWRLIDVQYNADKQGRSHLILYNDTDRMSAFWKLDSTGKLKNKTKGDGWDYIVATPPVSGLKLAALQQNADNAGNDHLIWQNSSEGYLVYWKLNSTGRLTNRTKASGWNYLSQPSISSDWQVVGVLKNADKQGNDHVLFLSNTSGLVVYWKLNSNGTLTNHTKGDGWDFVSDSGFLPPWTIATIQPNADGLNGDNLIWQNTGNGKLVYWKLDSTGKLLNRTKDSGWGYIDDSQPASTWIAKEVYLNCDSCPIW